MTRLRGEAEIADSGPCCRLRPNASNWCLRRPCSECGGPRVCRYRPCVYHAVRSCLPPRQFLERREVGVGDFRQRYRLGKRFRLHRVYLLEQAVRVADQRVAGAEVVRCIGHQSVPVFVYWSEAHPNFASRCLSARLVPTTLDEMHHTAAKYASAMAPRTMRGSSMSRGRCSLEVRHELPQRLDARVPRFTALDLVDRGERDA